LALTTGLLCRSFFLVALGVVVVPFTFAHLAFVAAMIAALPAALKRLLPFCAGLKAVAPVLLILIDFDSARLRAGLRAGLRVEVVATPFGRSGNGKFSIRVGSCLRWTLVGLKEQQFADAMEPSAWTKR
jgi:hypothetical protein